MRQTAGVVRPDNEGGGTSRRYYRRGGVRRRPGRKNPYWVPTLRIHNILYHNTYIYDVYNIIIIKSL
jgi:hypothetical protein